MTGIMCALAGGGGSIYLGTATVTVGYAAGGDFFSYGFDSGQGSITPALWANSGLPVATLKDVYYLGAPAWIDFTVTGEAPNSGWSTMTINGVTINRASGSYNYYSGSNRTTWIFTLAGPVFGTTVGATRSVVWA